MKKRRIKITKYLAAAFLALIFLSCFIYGLLSLKPNIRDSIYREISYQFVADNISSVEKDKEKIILLFFDYIHKNLNVYGGKPIDKTSWNDLLRGIGWCDQQSWAFATLLSKEDILARIVMLRNKESVSPHTVAEVFLNGKWLVFDPLNNLAFRDPVDRRLVTLEDLSHDPSIITGDPRVLSLPLQQRNDFISWYSTMFPLPMEPKRWAPLSVKKNSNLPKTILNKAITYYVRLGRKPLVNMFQDIYLAMGNKSFVSPQEYLYFKARNYHLYGRAGLTEKTYRQIINNYPQDEMEQDSRFFLGQFLILTKKDYAGGINELNGLFIKYPESKWAKVAYYLLGMAYELTGNIENARINYGRSNYDLDTDAAFSLSRLTAGAE